MFILDFELPVSPRPFIYHDDRITDKTVCYLNHRMCWHRDYLNIKNPGLKIDTYDGYMEIRGITSGPIRLILDCEED